MKVGIPIFSGRISPVFDWCLRVAVIEVDADASEKARENIDFSRIQQFSRPEYLSDLGVDVLLCGGISAELMRLIEARGIRIVPWVAGEVNAVLSAFLAGKLPDPQFMMPGRCGRGRRRRVRGGGR